MSSILDVFRLQPIKATLQSLHGILTSSRVKGDVESHAQYVILICCKLLCYLTGYQRLKLRILEACSL